MSIGRLRFALFVLFTASGFAGLIYESIWTHYLKLFLGHAAYAQTLVLSIFMGGMALGAWGAGRLLGRLAHPLLWYAGVEFAIGVCSLLFDPLFRALSAWTYDTLVPGTESVLLIDIVRWGLAALILVPQSVLLGTTFPFMSAAVVRLDAGSSGRSLSILYFTNSLGASVGILVAGFVLIRALGLPGTLLTAGIVNILLAVVVWALWKRAEIPAAPAPRATAPAPAGGIGVRGLLLVALLTGLASFVYEIAWIRMLALVLGSSTHAFELMLSAFILGLALGALFIRARIDRLASPETALGWIQVAMGLLALSTVVTYDRMFDVMSWLIHALARTDGGYALFNIASQLLCLLLMLPATFCAGMTLPLITNILLKRGAGEGAIGQVYAFNTVGGIAGVLVTVHLLMPALGLSHALAAGAAVDLAVGVFLLLPLLAAGSGRAKAALAVALLLFLGVATSGGIDPQRAASGVFRYGSARLGQEILFHQDGKTATVDVYQSADETRTMAIATNGKPDAAIAMGAYSSVDDATMILAGALPLAYRPDARRVAVIGLGSGRTTHTVLGHRGVERVDTIEIERAIVQGARLFGPAVARVYGDPRSSVHVEDAKTYFARHRERYDAIVSEPSNPWVSGVASLFTTEFYARVAGKLEPGGVLVQWLHVYEMDLSLIMTVLRAMAPHFEDMAIFAPNSGDIIIVATPRGTLPAVSPALFAEPGVRELLARIGIRNAADLQTRRVADSLAIGALLEAFRPQPNSDYFPILDQNAAHTRYLRSSAQDIFDLHGVTHARHPMDLAPVTAWASLPRVIGMTLVQHMARIVDSAPAPADLPAIPADALEPLLVVRDVWRLCPGTGAEASWTTALSTVVHQTTPYADLASVGRVAAHVRASPCWKHATATMRDWLEIWQGAAARDLPRVMAPLPALLASASPSQRIVLLRLAGLTALASGQAGQLRPLFEQYAPAVAGSVELKVLQALVDRPGRPAP